MSITRLAVCLVVLLPYASVEAAPPKATRTSEWVAKAKRKKPKKANKIKPVESTAAVAAPAAEVTPATPPPPPPAAMPVATPALAAPVADVPVSDSPPAVTPAEVSSGPQEIVAREIQGVPTADVQAELVVAPAAESTPPALFPLTASVGAGISLPQLVSKLGTGWHGVLGVGYLVPWWEQRLAAVVDLSFTRASRQASGEDARLVGASAYEYEIIERELVLNVGALLRFAPPAQSGLNYYGRVGLRCDWQRSDVNGEVGVAALGHNYEAAFEMGAALGGGVEYTVGPGAVAAELSFAFADLEHDITGNSSAGGLGFGVAYHLLF